MKTNLKALSALLLVFLIFPNLVLCEKWEVKKTRDNLGNVYDIAQVKNNEGYIFTVEAGFYTLGILVIPKQYNSAYIVRKGETFSEGKTVNFQVDNNDIERKTTQILSNGKEINIDLTEEDIKRIAKGQVINLGYYEKSGELIKIKFDLNGACIALSSIFEAPRFFSCKNDSGLQKSLTEALTREFKKEGWHDLTFEVAEQNTLIIRQTTMQKDKLSDGQVVGWMGAILKPPIVSKLKNAGFNKGIAIDDESRKYPFEISTKYYDEMMAAMQNAIRNR
jgi:hypothetical protein